MSACPSVLKPTTRPRSTVLGRPVSAAVLAAALLLPLCLVGVGTAHAAPGPAVTCTLNGTSISPVEAITGTAGVDNLECANGVPIGHPIDLLGGDDTVTIRGGTASDVRGGDGNDTINITGAADAGDGLIGKIVVDGGAGNDKFSISGGTGRIGANGATGAHGSTTDTGIGGRGAAGAAGGKGGTGNPGSTVIAGAGTDTINAYGGKGGTGGVGGKGGDSVEDRPGGLAGGAGAAGERGIPYSSGVFTYEPEDTFHAYYGGAGTPGTAGVRGANGPTYTP